jgi:hypothetical protein
MLLPYAIVVARGRWRRRRCGSGVVDAAVEEAVGISGFGIPNPTSAVLGRSLGHDTSPKQENN